MPGDCREQKQAKPLSRPVNYFLAVRRQSSAGWGGDSPLADVLCRRQKSKAAQSRGARPATVWSALNQAVLDGKFIVLFTELTFAARVTLTLNLIATGRVALKGLLIAVVGVERSSDFVM
ncbi:hypothetical protein GCM10010841_32480 [Deinococcus aerophilus]|uniref:Uncharacterized protein n=1 Tax=Deinococcus aerophilus TaxID=522488 RepID=A0ABQ2GZU2_9DEIO|nr:hypothetical protein GCM10010841_32480 [Deinococcus aerophilus]